MWLNVIARPSTPWQLLAVTPLDVDRHHSLLPGELSERAWSGELLPHHPHHAILARFGPPIDQADFSAVDLTSP